MSSQEDITLVNLHMQVNKPIIDSPLLMASYVTHLAQVSYKQIRLNTTQKLIQKNLVALCKLVALLHAVWG